MRQLEEGVSEGVSETPPPLHPRRPPTRRSSPTATGASLKRYFRKYLKSCYGHR